MISVIEELPFIKSAQEFLHIKKITIFAVATWNDL
jgi:hypothetical protein